MRIRYWSSDVCSSDRGQDVGAQSLSSSILPDRLGQFAPRRSRKPCQLLHLRQAWQYRCAPLLCQPRKLIGLGQGRCGIEKLEEVEQFDLWRIPGEIQLGQCNRAQYVVIAQFNQVFCFRSEEHTSELQSLMRTSYAVFCLKKKNK